MWKQRITVCLLLIACQTNVHVFAGSGSKFSSPPNYECSGTSYCYPAGQKENFDCDSDTDCITPKAGMQCGNANCGWKDWAGFADDCCEYFEPFQQLANAARIQNGEKSCSENSLCSTLCDQLGASDLKYCAVVSDAGYVVCQPPFPTWRLPTFLLGGGQLESQGSMTIKPEVLLGVKTCDGQPSVEATVILHIDKYFWDGTAPICNGDCNNPGGGINFRDVNEEFGVDADTKWRWTGLANSVGDGSTCLDGWKVECATNHDMTKTVTIDEGGSNLIIASCSEILSNSACGKLKIGETNLLDFHLALNFKLVKTEVGHTIDVGLVLCAEAMSQGICTDDFDAVVPLFSALNLPTSVASCASDVGEYEHLCDWDFQASESAMSQAPGWWVVALSAVLAAVVQNT